MVEVQHFVIDSCDWMSRDNRLYPSTLALHHKKFRFPTLIVLQIEIHTVFLLLKMILFSNLYLSQIFNSDIICRGEENVTVLHKRFLKPSTAYNIIPTALQNIQLQVKLLPRMHHFRIFLFWAMHQTPLIYRFSVRIGGHVSSGCLTGSWSIWSHAVTSHSTFYHLVFVI